MTSLRLATHQPRLLAGGGKGVGKSTFVRWLANRLLSDSKNTCRVVYLDLDPGQREVGLPGYISFTILNSPLLGTYLPLHSYSDYCSTLYFFYCGCVIHDSSSLTTFSLGLIQIPVSHFLKLIFSFQEVLQSKRFILPFF